MSDNEQVNCECGEMEYCAECMPAIQRVTRERQTHQYFELRYPNTDEVDEFTDEGDAQEWAVRMQRQGNTVAIYKRVVEVTKLFGEWEPIPAITPAEADAEMARAEVSQ